MVTMSARDKLALLLERLVDRSLAGDLAWGPSATAPSSYELEMPGGEKVVIDSRDDDFAPPYDMIVYASGGSVIGKLEWQGFGRGENVPRRSLKLQQLWELARDKSTGVTEVL